ncbi:MAG: hypothetical protein WBA67_10585 [Jannaschia sp.]
MRFLAIALMLVVLPLAAQAMDDRHPLHLSDVADAVGSAVLTADDVKLGHLVAFSEQGEGRFLCFVQLVPSLRVETSPLIVSGLLRHEDGTLRLAENAASIAERMKLPLVVN